MPLRKCAGCGGDLPAGATSRAKFCSSTCRSRGYRGSALSIVDATEPASEPEPASDVTTRLEALEEAAGVLRKLLSQSDPRSAAALSKEYRETLRELDSLRAEQQGVGASRDGGRTSERRPFNASAI